MMYINNRQFEWDDEKAAINFIKHGVEFKQATTAFHDYQALFEFDAAHSQLEQRHRLIGESEAGILVVIFTIRRQRINRLISARRANSKERRKYEEGKRV